MKVRPRGSGAKICIQSQQLQTHHQSDNFLSNHTHYIVYKFNLRQDTLNFFNLPLHDSHSTRDVLDRAGQ